MAEFKYHTSCDNCGSSDGKAVYSDGSHYCWVCNHVKPSEEYLNSKSERKTRLKDEDENFVVEKKIKPAITEAEKDEVKQETGYTQENYRGIRAETYKKFGVRHSIREDNGELSAQYYPVTQEGNLVGYKIRELPKSFGRSIGRTGSDCDLFGQFLFKQPGKYLTITEGELDSMAAYQMLNDYNESKGWGKFVSAVVSPTIGSNCKKQIGHNYKFLDQFEKIYVCFDNDSAGKAAVEQIIPSLPKGKVFLVNLRYKDPNEYLKNGKESEFLQDFFAAKQYVPAGVVASSDIYDLILSQSKVEKITLPPFTKKLEVKLGGGLSLGYIYNIAAQTGIGKTSLVNEFIYHWIFHSPHLVGVVSMELNSGQYGEALLSRHLEQKLARLAPEEKEVLLHSSEIIERGKDLFSKEDGSPRFYLVDDRDGTVEQLKDTIEEMIIGSGVKLVVLDVLQDILEGMSNEEQGLFMKWVKSMIKSHNVAFVLINHMRKKESGTSASKVDESDIHGSSTIMKSAAANILLTRDKDAEDEIERNTTYVTLSKNRLIGDTGPAGKIFYDKMTHVMHDFDEVFPNGPPSSDKEF